jgi:ribonuclease HI
MHGLVPHTQTFEREVVWLYQRYKSKIPKNTSTKTTLHTLPTSIIDSLITTFDISHSYFSSPVSCSTKISKFYSFFARDKIFGAIGTAFEYKWEGIDYAHPHNEETSQQAIHWARLAAKNDPNTITIVVLPNINWYQDPSPYTGPFPNTHVITQFAADTITYEEPTIPQKRQVPKTEPLAIRILCIHHQNHNIGTIHQMNTLKTTLDNLQIPQYYIHYALPTPHNTSVNKCKKWNKLIYPPAIYHTTLNTPTLPNFTTNTTPKFKPQHSYYTDGSFIPPIKKDNGHWEKEKAGYGIYNSTKIDMQISKRLLGLQTCFRAELMAIHKTLKLISKKYPNKPAHIFTDCLNCLYNLNTHIKHPTIHNNHADKTILTNMVDLLKTRTQPTTFYKVKAHIDIEGNEQADKLAKIGARKKVLICLQTI